VRKNQILRYLRSIQHDISFSSILIIVINNLFRKQGDIEWFKNQISKSLFIWTNHIEYWDKLDVAKYFLKGVVTEAQDYMTLIFVWKFKKVAVP
jgi:hypothetical protein